MSLMADKAQLLDYEAQRVHVLIVFIVHRDCL